MARNILITGGAGFIGSHLADRLCAEGHRVQVLDALLPQVHGGAGRPVYLSEDVELVHGDVGDAAAVDRYQWLTQGETRAPAVLPRHHLQEAHL